MNEFTDQLRRMYGKRVTMTGIATGNVTIWHSWETPYQRQVIGCKAHDTGPAVGNVDVWQVECLMDECVQVLLDSFSRSFVIRLKFGIKRAIAPASNNQSPIRKLAPILVAFICLARIWEKLFADWLCSNDLAASWKNAAR